MSQILVLWWQVRWKRVAAGAAVWAAVAVTAALFANASGRPVWPTIVTWDEWLVAIGLLPFLAMWLLGIRDEEDFARPAARRVIRAFLSMGTGMLVVFLLDILTRFVFGLGWKPF
ncbi:MAG TPA: hypothetical protein VD902_21685 [Symbiobacteriaceae bacterium]|nr:hypothetical protein [Symbiobacteriaceae bacterium]